MFLKKWDELPDCMKNDSVKVYYDILEKKKVNLFFKRIFDIILSILLIILLSPVIVTTAIVIKLDSQGKVFFRQRRVTQYGRVFKIFKFRTMIENQKEGSSEVTLSDDDRITKCGKILRKFRIDEIPQLFNILIGDMSFVGPRPEVEKYVKSYDNQMMASLLLPAGVTSMASVAFRNEDQLLNDADNVDFVYIMSILPSKMELNLEYVKNVSVLNDIKVMFITFITVFLKS
mgnify:CR=1 FL=1